MGRSGVRAGDLVCLRVGGVVGVPSLPFFVDTEHAMWGCCDIGRGKCVRSELPVRACSHYSSKYRCCV